jgi:hypothetical protein
MCSGWNDHERDDRRTADQPRPRVPPSHALGRATGVPRRPLRKDRGKRGCSGRGIFPGQGEESAAATYPAEVATPAAPETAICATRVGLRSPPADGHGFRSRLG